MVIGKAPDRKQLRGAVCADRDPAGVVADEACPQRALQYEVPEAVGGGEQVVVEQAVHEHLAHALVAQTHFLGDDLGERGMAKQLGQVRRRILGLEAPAEAPDATAGSSRRPHADG